MSDAADHDYPCSSTFRDGLSSSIDYRTSSTFADRRPSRRGPDIRAYVAEIDMLRREIRELRSELRYWRHRAAIAEELAHRQTPLQTCTFDGPEVSA